MVLGSLLAPRVMGCELRHTRRLVACMDRRTEVCMVALVLCSYVGRWRILDNSRTFRRYCNERSCNK